jgi:hypothetical protein
MPIPATASVLHRRTLTLDACPAQHPELKLRYRGSAREMAPGADALRAGQPKTTVGTRGAAEASPYLYGIGTVTGVETPASLVAVMLSDWRR